MIESVSTGTRMIAATLLSVAAEEGKMPDCGHKFKWRKAILWGAIGLAVVCLLGMVGITLTPILTVDKNNPPSSLEKSVETVIESVYPVLRGAGDEKKLYAILEPEVAIYYLFHPKTIHSEHPFEYRVGLYQSRWHAGVYPVNRITHKDKVYEIWRAGYAGGGHWSKVLRAHSVYYITSADSIWSKRTVLLKRGSLVGPNEQNSFEGEVKLPEGEVISFPPGPKLKKVAGQD
jgi:hypothetical protein